MPSHQERIRRNCPEINCKHKFHFIWGIDVTDCILAGKICELCATIVDLGKVGIDDIDKEWIEWFNKDHDKNSKSPNWYSQTIDLSQIQQNIKDLLK